MHQSYNLLSSNFHKSSQEKNFGGVKRGRKLVHVFNSVLLYSYQLFKWFFFSNHLLKGKGTLFSFNLTRFLKASW